MQLIRDARNCPRSLRGSVLALGNFDGVHLGHQAILKQCVALAAKKNTHAAVMTFAPHPRLFFAADKKPVAIYGFRQKFECLEATGIKTLFAARFNAALSKMSAQEFIEDILHKSLGVAHIFTGYNFAFGKGRQGSPELLAHEAARLGFGYTALGAIENNGETVSTSAIRAALAEGNTAHASALLGRPYAIEGRVIHGNKRGQAIGFPTANIHVGRLFTPRYGVYSIRALIDGRPHHGVANLGVKPTTCGSEPLLEAHIFDFSASLYGKRIKVELGKFIRAEQKFSGMDALTTQIRADVAQAKEILLHNAP